MYKYIKKKIIPRDYQIECLKIINSNNQNHLICIATGGGKTVIFSLLSKYTVDNGERVLIVVSQEELIEQAYSTLLSIDDNLDIGIVKGNRKNLSNKIIIATRQTLTSKASIKNNLMEQMRHYGKFKYVIVDEVHQANEQIKKIFKYNDNSIFLGFTATPFDLQLSEVFPSKLSFKKDMTDLIKENYLCKFEIKRIITQVDISNVQKDKNGDYLESALEEALNIESRNQTIVEEILEIKNYRKSIIVFCSGIKHVKNLTKKLQLSGVNAVALYSNKNNYKEKSQRSEIVKKFKNGEIHVLVNDKIASTGFDAPNVDCLVFATPTRSKILYTQRLGRGLRLCDEKENCLVIEFVDKNKNNDSVKIEDIIISNKLFMINSNENHYKINNSNNPYNTVENLINIDTSNLNTLNIYKTSNHNSDSLFKIYNKVEEFNWRKEEFGMMLLINKKETFIILKNFRNMYDIYLLRKSNEKNNYSYPLPKKRNIKLLEEAIETTEQIIISECFETDRCLADKTFKMEDSDDNFKKIQNLLNRERIKILDSLKSINYISFDI